MLLCNQIMTPHTPLKQKLLFQYLFVLWCDAVQDSQSWPVNQRDREGVLCVCVCELLPRAAALDRLLKYIQGLLLSAIVFVVIGGLAFVSQPLGLSIDAVCIEGTWTSLPTTTHPL